MQLPAACLSGAYWGMINLPAFRIAGMILATICATALAQPALADPPKPAPGSTPADPLTTGALPASTPVASPSSSTAASEQKPAGPVETKSSPDQSAESKSSGAATSTDKAEADQLGTSKSAAVEPSSEANKTPDGGKSISESKAATGTSEAKAPEAKPAETKTESKTANAAAADAPKVEAPAESAAAAPAPPPAADPIIEALRKKLADKSLAGKDVSSQDLAAMSEFYGSRSAPLWVQESAFNSKGKAIIEELKKADDWGLESSDFRVADLASGSSADQQADAEAGLTLAAMKYARFARGGRLDPVSLSNILDMKPPVKDSKTVISELSAASDPASYLRGLNPQHEGFKQLREALLKMRGPAPDAEAIDPALLVKLPDAAQLKPGATSDEVALLRKRLKIAAASSGDENVYSDDVVAAIKGVQQANGLKANGIINNRVRAILNKEGEPKKADPKRDVDRILANMERWRWLPENLGDFYVLNNIPEFSSEIYRGGKLALKQKMIVGQPSWPTPILVADMQIVATHPSWGMPPGIKMKELLPRVRAAGGGGFDFFDQLFGGGSTGAGAIIRAYKLQAYCNGRSVSPDAVTADNVQNCSFTQPPGADNPLGTVKFRFPNRHDVYMHDTPERGLFAQSMRALSHGCMRVEEPKKTAEIILGEDKGWSAEKVDGLFAGSTEVTLTKSMPVYLVYFTARVDADGRMQRYGDIYGHDDRIMSALRGRPVRYTAPEAIEDTDADPAPTASAPPAKRNNRTASSDAASDTLDDSAPPPAKNKKGKNNRQADKQPKKQPRTAGDMLMDSLSGGFLN